MKPELKLNFDPKILFAAVPISQAYFNLCCRRVEQVVVDDFKLGAVLRQQRINQGVSLRSHAAALGVSAPYVSDLELGRRHWNKQRVDNYLKALPVMPKEPELRIGQKP